MHWNYICFFHSEGNVPISRQDLKISSKGGKIDSPHNFSIRILIMSCPWALFGSRFFIILAISLQVTGIHQSVLVVFYVQSRMNFTCIAYHSALLSKKLLSSSALSIKFKMNLLLWNSGGMQGIFLLMRNVFKSDQ